MQKYKQFINCLSFVGFAIGAIFVKEVFHQESKVQAEEMINNVRDAFKNNFKNLKWMDEWTRKVAIEKADAMTDMIGKILNKNPQNKLKPVFVTGYPEFVKDTNQLDERFENLSIRSESYFENNIQINFFNLRQNLEKIKESVNRTTWSELVILHIIG